MRLLRLADVQTGPAARVYAHSRMRAVLGLTIALALAAAAAAAALRQGHTTLACAVAALLILGLLFARGPVAARFHPTNWLVITDDRGLFIKFRSYLNLTMPDDVPTVVYIPYAEIRSAHLVIAKTTSRDVNGAREVGTRRIVALELAGDTAPLQSALAAELARPAPRVRRWYGSSSTRYGDYPVQWRASNTLGIEWHVVPGTRPFLDALRNYTTIDADERTDEDTARLLTASPEDREAQLRAFVLRGDTVAAIQLVRLLDNCSLAEAKNYVERLKATAPGTTGGR